MIQLTCPRCDVELVAGIAINGTAYGRGGIVPNNIPITSLTLELISVVKCPLCGYSDDGKGDGSMLMGVINHNV